MTVTVALAVAAQTRENWLPEMESCHQCHCTAPQDVNSGQPHTTTSTQLQHPTQGRCCDPSLSSSSSFGLDKDIEIVTKATIRRLINNI